MFKSLIKATVAATLIASPVFASAAEAQSRQHSTTTTIQHRPNGTVVKKTTVQRQQPTAYRHNNNRHYNDRQWRKGQRFDRREARNYRVVDYRQYRGRQLYAPPRGHQWVRSGNDAVLIAASTGIIAAILANALR